MVVGKNNIEIPGIMVGNPGEAGENYSGNSEKHVNTGEIFVVHPPGKLVADALGSCIAIVLYDRYKGVGGMAHAMLPGRAPEGTCEPFKYIETALEELLRRLEEAGASRNNLISYLAGAGNVLKRADDTICTLNIYSAITALCRENLEVAGLSLGGFERRKIRLETGTGMLFLSTGDSEETPVANFLTGRWGKNVR